MEACYFFPKMTTKPNPQSKIKNIMTNMTKPIIYFDESLVAKVKTSVEVKNFMKPH